MHSASTLRPTEDSERHEPREVRIWGRRLAAWPRQRRGPECETSRSVTIYLVAYKAPKPQGICWLVLHGRRSVEPDNFTTAGILILITGFAMAAFGGFLFGEVYFCAINSTNCPLSSVDASTRVGYSIPLLIFGSFLITTGAIFTAAGHISEYLRPAEVSEKESEKEATQSPLRVWVKCGRQVEPSASYCPSCGNQLTKPLNGPLRAIRNPSFDTFNGCTHSSISEEDEQAVSPCYQQPRIGPLVARPRNTTCPFLAQKIPRHRSACCRSLGKLAFSSAVSRRNSQLACRARILMGNSWMGNFVTE